MDEEENINQLLNFSYQIRPSTKQFCEQLVLKYSNIKSNMTSLSNDGDSTVEYIKTLSEVIEDSNWFFKYWLKDPSIKGMLNMLDEIHNQCESFTQDNFMEMWNNIAVNHSINFELLDLDEFELTDELYVKMNARGKALTSFENFKSWLMEYVESEEINIGINDWKHKLDTSWADLFWDNKDDENMLIDEEYLIYFRNMMQLNYVLLNSLDVKTEVGTENREVSSILAPTRKKKKDSEFYHEYPSLSVSSIIEYDVLNEKNLNELFLLLDIISSYYRMSDQSLYNMIKPIFFKFITGNITLPDKAMFYGLAQFLQHNEETITKENLQAFLRILANLIKNTEIDNISILQTIVKGFIEDAKYYNSTIDVVGENLKFSGFRVDQIHEEKLKILLRSKEDTDWNVLLDEAESHKYFQGQIGFLLHLSGLNDYYSKHDDMNLTSVENNVFENNFKEYLLVAQKIFKDVNDDGKTNKLMNRALLTYGDYLIKDSSYRTFPRSDKHRDNSWYRFMRDFKEESKYNYIWHALELLFNDLKDAKTLEEIIQNVPTNWRECFVLFPETLDRCGKYQHFRVVGKDIYLLSKSTKKSDYTELETFHLFKSKFKQNINDYAPFNNADYWVGNTNNGEPYTYLYGYEINGFEIELKVYHHGNKEHPWEIYIAVTDGDISKLHSILDSILTNNDFSFETEHNKFDMPVYMLKLDGDISSVNDTIKTICLDFKNL